MFKHVCQTVMQGPISESHSNILVNEPVSLTMLFPPPHELSNICVFSTFTIYGKRYILFLIALIANMVFCTSLLLTSNVLGITSCKFTHHSPWFISWMCLSRRWPEYVNNFNSICLSDHFPKNPLNFFH